MLVQKGFQKGFWCFLIKMRGEKLKNGLKSQKSETQKELKGFKALKSLAKRGGFFEKAKKSTYCLVLFFLFLRKSTKLPTKAATIAPKAAIASALDAIALLN